MTTPKDNELCTKEDILKTKLFVSELRNKVTEQSTDICQLRALVTKVENDVLNIRKYSLMLASMAPSFLQKRIGEIYVHAC